MINQLGGSNGSLLTAQVDLEAADEGQQVCQNHSGQRIDVRSVLNKVASLNTPCAVVEGGKDNDFHVNSTPSQLDRVRSLCANVSQAIEDQATQRASAAKSLVRRTCGSPAVAAVVTAAFALAAVASAMILTSDWTSNNKIMGVVGCEVSLIGFFSAGTYALHHQMKQTRRSNSTILQAKNPTAQRLSRQNLAVGLL